MKRAESDNEYPLGPAFEFLQQLWKLDHAREQLSLRMETALGITAQQRFLLRVVSRYPGIGAGQLARLLHVDSGTVSASLARLESKSLLERHKDPVDKRRASLCLTAKGRGLDQPTPGTAEHVVEEFLSEISESDLVTTMRVLETLTKRLEASRPGLARRDA